MEPAVPTPPRGPIWREVFQTALASYLKAGYVPWLARMEAATTADAVLVDTADDEPLPRPSARKGLNAMTTTLDQALTVFAEFRDMLRSHGLHDQVVRFDDCLELALTPDVWTKGPPPLSMSGIWTHYKGGLYTVIGTARHHETDWPLVVYVSHEHGGMSVRPVVGHRHDQDGWLNALPDGKPRFTRP